jgi:hypothetical protein
MTFFMYLRHKNIYMFSMGEDWNSYYTINESGNEFHEKSMWSKELCFDIVRFKKQIIVY